LENFLKYLEEWKKEVDAMDLTSAEKEKRMLSRQTLDGIERTVRAFTGAIKFIMRLKKASL